MNRRDFVRRGALWLSGAALVEPVTRKLWAFPNNPLGTGAATSKLFAAVNLTKFNAVDVSFDGGVTWHRVDPQGPYVFNGEHIRHLMDVDCDGRGITHTVEFTVS